MYVDKMIYPVEAKCGALPCPPYGDGYFVYCVVCTKQTGIKVLLNCI